MALTKIGDFTTPISSLNEQPSQDGMTAAELQAAFDSNATEIKTAFNALIDALEATTNGSSGADAIKITAIPALDAAANVQSALEGLVALIAATVTNIGAGDMAKSTYDTDADGKVNSAVDSDKLGGIVAANYIKTNDNATLGTINATVITASSKVIGAVYA